MPCWFCGKRYLATPYPERVVAHALVRHRHENRIARFDAAQVFVCPGRTRPGPDRGLLIHINQLRKETRCARQSAETTTYSV